MIYFLPRLYVTGCKFESYGAIVSKRTEATWAIGYPDQHGAEVFFSTRRPRREE